MDMNIELARPEDRSVVAVKSRVPFHRRGAVVATNFLLAVAIAALPACGGGDEHSDQETAATADDVQTMQAPTLAELSEAAALARSEGQTELANDLDALVAAKGNGQSRVWGIALKLAKKALILALRHGGPSLAKLVGKLSPKAAKVVQSRSKQIADVLEETTVWEELVITNSLVAIHIEPSTAAAIAKWIVIFVG